MKEDPINTAKLGLVLARLGLSRREVADRVGLKKFRFHAILNGAVPTPTGLRTQVEVTLGLEAGALRY